MCYTQSTASVQSLSQEVQDKALELVSLNPESANVISVLDGLIHYCASLSYTGPGSQTALDTLRNGFGLCYGKANLAAGLCRALGIPARTCTVHPTHSIVEIWIPEYGWIKACATDGLFPWPDNILMIPVWTADIDDENIMAAEKDGVILYGGLENVPHSEYWWEPGSKDKQPQNTWHDTGFSKKSRTDAEKNENGNSGKMFSKFFHVHFFPVHSYLEFFIGSKRLV